MSVAPGEEHDREIWRLAVPAFLALVAEPLFLLSDAAIVGHLGTPELAGLGIAAVVLQTAVGLCVFLAYGTTASVARYLGAGDRARALAQGIDGVWLAVLIGVVVTVAGVALTDPLVAAFGAGDEVSEQATTYLRIAFLGTTPLLVMLATTGVLRGLQDTRTPLVVAVAGNALNIVLNLLLVYGVGLLRRPRHRRARPSARCWPRSPAPPPCSPSWSAPPGARARRCGPDRAGIRAAARAAVALVIRTLTLRAALLVTTYAVAAGATGGEGAGRPRRAPARDDDLGRSWRSCSTRSRSPRRRSPGGTSAPATSRAPGTVTRRMVWWGVVSGVVHRRRAGRGQPVARRAVHRGRGRARPAGAGAARRRARPADGRGGVRARRGADRRRRRHATWPGRAPPCWSPTRRWCWWPRSAGGGLVWVWVVFAGVFMGARFVALVGRARGDRWLVTGA